MPREIYIPLITEAIQQCDDADLLDLIFKLLMQKAQQ